MKPQKRTGEHSRRAQCGHTVAPLRSCVALPNPSAASRERERSLHFFEASEAIQCFRGIEPIKTRVLVDKRDMDHTHQGLNVLAKNRRN